MRLDLRKPCNECPFRRTAPAGWLGPWNVEDLLRSLATTPFPCHRTIHGQEDMSDNTLQGCAGAAIFLNNKLEMSRHPLTYKHQQLCKGVPQEIKDSVFQWPNEFRQHHQNGVFAKEKNNAS